MIKRNSTTTLAIGLLTLALLAVPFTARAQATPQDGTVDTSFGYNGSAETDFAKDMGGATINVVLAQADGKLIAAGATINSVGKPDMFTLARYNSDGSLDTSFGSSGIVKTAMPGGGSGINAAVLQSDGKILVAGKAGSHTGLARYNSDGSLDTGFGIQGKVVLNLDQFSDSASSVAVQSDGKILVGGGSVEQYCNIFASCSAVNYWSNSYLLSILNPDGSLHTDFGNNGVLTISIKFAPGDPNDGSAFFPSINLIKPLANGKTLLGGSYSIPENGTQHFQFWLLDSTSAFDTSFGVDGGIVDGVRTNGMGTMVDATILPNGEILALAYGSPTDFSLVLYKPDGSRDTSFGQNGEEDLFFFGGYGSQVRPTALLEQTDGKLVVVGSKNMLPVADRFNADFTLDTTFGYQGKAVAFGNAELVNAAALTSSGKIVTAGQTGTPPAFALAQFNNNGASDMTFGSSGMATTQFGPTGNTDSGEAMALQGSDKIVVAGTTTGKADSDFALARYALDGSLDASFGAAGKITTDLGSNQDKAHAMAVQPDGKIIVAGQSGNTPEFAIARYNADGSLDTGFGTGGKVFDPNGNVAWALALQPDGKIVVGGYHAAVAALTRYNSDGSVDTGFGNGGKYYSVDGRIVSMALGPDGKIVAAAAPITPSIDSKQFDILRVTTAGAPDLSFDSDGIASPSAAFTSMYDRYEVRAVAVQPDGKIVASGSYVFRYRLDSTYLKILVARFNTDGALAGIDTESYSQDLAEDGRANALAIQADGKILVSGFQARLLRLLPNGVLDTSFANDFSRHEYVDRSGPQPVVPLDPLAQDTTGILILPDSQIVTAGTIGYPDGADFVVTRYNNSTIIPSTATPTSTNTATVTATATATATPVAFSDVAPSDYFYTPVEYLAGHGVISGYSDGSFRPYNNTTRGQLAKIVTLAEGYQLVSPTTPTFQDVPTSDTFYSFIETAVQHNLISGYDLPSGGREFRPGANVTRGQLAKIVVSAAGFTLLDPMTATFADVPKGSVFYQFVETAAAHNLIAGYDLANGAHEFRPQNSATRGQIAKIVYLAVTTPSGAEK